jgi:endonuclease/exonuclease/phosphatase family metal-dependent hydrolase
LGWDATYRRTLSIAKLLDAQSKTDLLVFNTHFDNEGETARQESATLLLSEIAKVDATSPLIVTGDFNFTLPAIPYDMITQVLADAEKISATAPSGARTTFNGFGNDKNPDNKIDFVFVRKTMTVSDHRIDTTTYNNLYPSDHYPIITTVNTAISP